MGTSTGKPRATDIHQTRLILNSLLTKHIAHIIAEFINAWYYENKTNLQCFEVRLEKGARYVGVIGNFIVSVNAEAVYIWDHMTQVHDQLMMTWTIPCSPPKSLFIRGGWLFTKSPTHLSKRQIEKPSKWILVVEDLLTVKQNEFVFSRTEWTQLSTNTLLPRPDLLPEFLAMLWAKENEGHCQDDVVCMPDIGWFSLELDKVWFWSCGRPDIGRCCIYDELDLHNLARMTDSRLILQTKSSMHVLHVTLSSHGLEVKQLADIPWHSIMHDGPCPVASVCNCELQKWQCPRCVHTTHIFFIQRDIFLLAGADHVHILNLATETNLVLRLPKTFSFSKVAVLSDGQIVLVGDRVCVIE